MKLTRLRIKNFRSVRELGLELGDTNVFVGPNNAGKSAILDALRIALTRRWGQRGTGFTEHDVYRPDEHGIPKALPPVQIEVTFEEPGVGAWDPDMVANLEDIAGVLPDGRSSITLRVTAPWSEEKDAFDPVWEFLDITGTPMGGKAQRATNLSGFFSYVPLFWLDALRDASDEFSPRSQYWGRLLRAVRVPEDVATETLSTLAALDAKIIGADPNFTRLAKLVGQATHVALGDTPGDARPNALPLSLEDMIQRAGIVLRYEDGRPWLPLGQHGQGLQSLAVIFLFQAVAMQQLEESTKTGVEPIFAIEEPEVHLHPQAARSLWGRIAGLKGQKLLTTHSPYFVQNVPLRDLRLLRLDKGSTVANALPRRIISSLPWTLNVDQLVRETGSDCFERDPGTGNVAAVGPVSGETADRLGQCYRKDGDAPQKVVAARTLRRDARILVSKDEEGDLGFHGRRVRGEIFFAHRWVLVEGVCEYLLLQAIAAASDWPLDAHGIAVIDFQQSGSPGVYVSLAEAFGIPWDMVVDGDAEGDRFQDQILRRGFVEADLKGHFETLPKPNVLEQQLVADGHEALLRTLMTEIVGQSATTCTTPELLGKLSKYKTDCTSRLARRVASDSVLAAQMPAALVSLVKKLKGDVA